MKPEDEPFEPWQDPIVAEVRAAREEIFAAAGFDLEVLGRQLRESQAASGRKVVSLPPRRPGDRRGAAA